MEIVFSNYLDSIGPGYFGDLRELLLTRVSQAIEASLMSYTHPSTAQERHDKYGGKVRELVYGLGEDYCSSILSVVFEDKEVADSLQVRFKGRKDIRLNIYFDDPQQLLFDNEDEERKGMMVDNEDEAYLSYLFDKERYVDFGPLHTIVKELKTILSNGVPRPTITPITL